MSPLQALSLPAVIHEKDGRDKRLFIKSTVAIKMAKQGLCPGQFHNKVLKAGRSWEVTALRPGVQGEVTFYILEMHGVRVPKRQAPGQTPNTTSTQNESAMSAEEHHHL